MAVKLHVIQGRQSGLPEDEDIKLLATTDHKAAVSLIVLKYRNRLYNHAMYILKDGQQAFDVTQEVFIKAIREHRFFTEEFKMKAWLFRVTSNLCFNIVRDKRRRGAILEAMPMATCSAADQLDRVFNGEQQQTISHAMDRLSSNHRDILMLRYYSDLSYAEIADTLNVKLGTVMSRLSRAKNRLVEVLDDPGVLGS